MTEQTNREPTEVINGLLADWQKELRSRRQPVRLEELLPGEANSGRREALRSRGYYEEVNAAGLPVKYGAYVAPDGYVLAAAATVSRTPSRSFDYVRDIRDFQDTSDLRQADKVALYYRIYENEPMVNNAINVSAALVSMDGRFMVRRARKGKRPRGVVRDELAEALNWWKDNVNSRPEESAITGARGLPMIMEQGSRQALIEGSYIGYWYPQTINVPSLGKTFILPMFVQSLSTQYIEIPTALVGTGQELFFWVPPRNVIQAYTNPSDPDVKEAIQNTIDADVLAQLRNNGRVKLDRSRVIHVKHRGVETQPFGESQIAPAMVAIKYKRALEALDFVTIDSLVNRLVIVKVGSDNPSSSYHNLETAQMRLELLRQMYNSVDPNMHLLWAGPDIEVVEVGAHNSILDIDGRYKMAKDNLRIALGTPQALLDGTEAGGQIWAGYEGYREKLVGMRMGWVQAFTSLAQRIAALNGYEDTEIIFVPNSGLLADQKASADLALRMRKAGLASIRRTIVMLDGDFETERRNRLIEMGYDPDGNPEGLPSDDQIFAPPLGFPGDTRTNPDGNIRDPGGEPGRRPDSMREDIAPEREPNNRHPDDADMEE